MVRDIHGDSASITVSYPRLPPKCSNCSCFGHLIIRCPKYPSRSVHTRVRIRRVFNPQDSSKVVPDEPRLGRGRSKSSMEDRNRAKSFPPLNVLDETRIDPLLVGTIAIMDREHVFAGRVAGALVKAGPTPPRVGSEGSEGSAGSTVPSSAEGDDLDEGFIGSEFWSSRTKKKARQMSKRATRGKCNVRLLKASLAASARSLT